MALKAQKENALLQLIRSVESSNDNDAYRMMNGNSFVIQDLSDHPYYTGETSKRYKAAGAFQFQGATWQSDIKPNLPNITFSPADQEKAALRQIYDKKHINWETQSIEEIISRLSEEWAGLPANGYTKGYHGQAHISMTEAINRYNNFLNKGYLLPEVVITPNPLKKKEFNMNNLLAILPTLIVTIITAFINWFKQVKERDEKKRKRFFIIMLCINAVILAVPFIIPLFSKKKS